MMDKRLIISFLCILAFNSIFAQQQPNIIYINTDDWGIGKVPAYKMDDVSMKMIRTPNIDKLRAEGMQFSNAYAGNAVCGPSRCSLLTGKHPGNAAWRANRKEPPVKHWPPKYPMLPEVARQAGYATAGFGKLSSGGTDTPENITAYGFDYWLGFLGHIDCRDFYSSYIYETGKKIQLSKNNPEVLAGTVIKGHKGGVVGEGKGTFIEDLYTDKILEFITKSNAKKKPFFVYFASTVPHGGPPGGMRVPSIEGYDKVGKLKLREQVYCALMTRHDRNVGRITAHLRKLGIEKNTIVIWTSDNGDEDSYYGRTKTFDGNGPFKGVKRSLTEGGIRVPLIAWWPGTIPANSNCDLVTTQWDLMPTVADAGNDEVTKEMDGISIMPTLRGEASKQTKREYIYFEFFERGKQQSVRLGDWKAYRRGGPGKRMFLYDLKTDQSEKKDLAKQHPDIVKRMEEIMEKEHSPNPVWKFKK